MVLEKQAGGWSGAAKLAAAATCALLTAFGLAGCQHVQGTTPIALVRVIDASYIAPPANVSIENKLFAGNIAQGYISNYGTVTPSAATTVSVSPVTGTTPTASAAVTLNASTQHTVFITDNGQSATQYVLTVLEDQDTAAAIGHSTFRFLNQAPRTGAVDIYMVPSGSEITDTIPLVTNLALGASTAYISFTSQTVTMVITPTGTVTPKYTSAALALTGGEVRTVVAVDSQLTTNPPVQALIADDVN
ncbi:DUF4397 domain-containing protein [Terracidiphilus gabretensis]|uniref:DUF4397 domain-containing protein n=1 Tax=Terracidiphilus gabretensis TaxID=1577687 RepID=UPI00071AFF8A|nr:DUF4397 domain-containing protein [Terracidiphilus gabretensis]